MNPRNLALAILSLGLFHLTNFSQTATPEWIWADRKGEPRPEKEAAYFRKVFTVTGEVTKAQLTATGDDTATIYLNDRPVIRNAAWQKPGRVTVTADIREGENVLAARGTNAGGEAGFILKLELTLQGGKTQTIVSDQSWQASSAAGEGWEKTGFDATAWGKAASLGKLGTQPWGDVLSAPQATAASQITVPHDFKIELIRSAQSGEGSWVAMAIDAKGRLIVSPQEGVGNLLRLTLSASGQVEKIEDIDLPVGSAMGLLYAFDSLYISGKGPEGLGLYRIRDTNNDDLYDELRLLKKFDGAAGEHGSHAIVLGPDKMIYYIHGNFAKVPADISEQSPHKNFAEDQLLPRAEDGNGFGVGIKPPGGFVLRGDPEGKHWELFAAGMRNTYDFAFNADGEMFGFDSDMEWDWGMPWYRPIRVCHLVSGGDYGFREGSGKFPPYYADTLPPVVEVGVGSPTGVKFGTDSRFPAKYQKAMFAMDWSYGRILAVHLTPHGASYGGTFEQFVKGKPLNVTDMEFGKDGALYFLTGGRGTQSGLYRVSYIGNESVERAAPDSSPEAKETATARDLRHKLEAFHGKRDSKAIDFAWPHLNSPDRFIRYAARIAIEAQDVSEWQEKALQETQPNGSITALLALARRGNPSVQTELVKALGRFPAAELSEEQVLAALRVVSLAFIRMGHPDEELSDGVIEALDPLYPARTFDLNRELSQLLIYLRAPGVIGKTLTLLEAAPTQEEQIHYVFHLRTLKTGWTVEDRKRYFGWFNANHDFLAHPPQLIQWFHDAGREYDNGASFPKFIANIRRDAVATLSDGERGELAGLISGKETAAKPAIVQRSFVKEWKMEDILPALNQVSKGRSFQKGKEAYVAAQCATCHRFGKEGGDVGPDITAISSRFARRDVLESIIDPSKVVSEQYQNTALVLRNGDDITGRVIEETGDKLIVVTNPLLQTKTEVRKADIQKRAASKISPMPEGLVNVLSKNEILDLLAYLESGGNAEAPFFK